MSDHHEDVSDRAGVLFVVATPLGNLADISERATRVLGEVDLVLAEDTRRGAKLLSALGLSAPLESFHGDTVPGKRERLVARLSEGATMALTTDAGTPCISDPGAELIAEAAAAGVKIVPVPGPASITTALSVSGLSGQQFEFLGYAPRRETQRREFLLRALASPVTTVFFETPHRIVACLRDLALVAGDDQRLVICRELTKLHEEIMRATASEALAHFETGEPLGEFVMLLPAGGGDAQPGDAASDGAVREAGERLLELGVRTKDAAGVISTLTGRARNDLYEMLLRLRTDD